MDIYKCSVPNIPHRSVFEFEDEQYWILESERRSEKYKTGKVNGIPAEKVLKELREKYR